ncbi:hypothetical protein BJV78DRAFT_1350260 [Lactifluus subvellereus]|nr:hypothetical protein BJV78DRAFT_1350260 [Lactifluus subvellereus]
MSINLYETLGVQRDATEEQIRKAYHRRALQTHPDRVPPERKLTAEDEFRKVNNAYEVLNDPTKRQAYDAHGVWPPPPPGSGGSRHRHRPYRPSREPHVHFPEEPFDFGWHDHAGFTDPFRLFESIFGELRHAMSDPFFPDPWRRDRRHDRARDFFDDPLIDVDFPFDRHGGFDDMMGTGNGRTRVYSQVSRGTVGPDGRWVSESRMTRTVNGVTESVWKRRDGVGNEYATYTYPDGRERHTLNGRDQIGSQPHVPPPRVRQSSPPPPPLSPSPSPSPPPIQTSALPPPPPFSNMSRKRESPTSVSGRTRDSPTGREHHSPIEIQSSSRAGTPPPPLVNHSHHSHNHSHNHHYRPPPPPHPPPTGPSHFRGGDPNMSIPAVPPPHPPPTKGMSHFRAADPNMNMPVPVVPPHPPTKGASRFRGADPNMNMSVPVVPPHPSTKGTSHLRGVDPNMNMSVVPPPHHPPPKGTSRFRGVDPNMNMPAVYPHETPHYKSRWWKK